MPKTIVPSLGLESFSCPHCGALAHQHWFKLSPKQYERDTKPEATVFTDFNDVDPTIIENDNKRRTLTRFLMRLEKNDVTYRVHDYNRGSEWELHNVAASLCHSCDAWALWVKGGLVYPVVNSEIVAHEDLPGLIRDDFQEAADIVDRSPRGAAALLRLCIQKIMPVLGEAGKNINTDIKELIKKGIEPDIAKALDILRVVGNESVHPGTMDLKDDKAIALNLFELVNIIVEKQIAGPARIAALFAGLPLEKLAEIEKRDAPKAIEDKTDD